AAHPERAAILERLLPSIEAMARHGREMAGRRPTASFPGGRRTLGEFQFVREIGRGGMGVVYEAIQSPLGRSVALKVLPLATASDPRHLERFQLEARAAACLRHPHIVPVYGVGCEDEVPYFAMQFIEGRSLAEVLAALRLTEGVDGPEGNRTEATPDGLTRSLAADLARIGAGSTVPDPPAALAGGDGSPVMSTARPELAAIDRRSYPRAVARLGHEVAEALEHAHAHRIIHRDIKPGNLILDGRGHIWVTDFGLARFLDDTGLTASGDVLGTLRYMSHEQALGSRATVDGRADVYSLGVTLYELLTLRAAFGGGDRAEILRAVDRGSPAPPRRLNPAISRDLETIVLKAMAREPADRYATALELAADLARFLDGRPIAARRPGIVDRAAKLAARNRGVVVAATLLSAMTLVGSVGMLAWSNNWLRAHNEELTNERNRGKQLARQAELHRADAEKQRDLAEHRRRMAERFFQGAQLRLAGDALGEGRFERAQDILHDLEAAPGDPGRSDFAWHWLWRRACMSATPVYGHDRGVRSLAFSPDRRTLATGDHGGAIRLWDATDGRPLGSLDGHTTSVNQLCFTPDGRFLASAAENALNHRSELSLWELSTRRRTSSLIRLDGWLVNAIGIGRDGSILWSHFFCDTKPGSQVIGYELAREASSTREVRRWGSVDQVNLLADGRVVNIVPQDSMVGDRWSAGDAGTGRSD
ncbi:MAG: protein kinase, partial [Thermoleophilia bacterium]|nr:protein kinase [Thermoleophilia bacterium]